MSIEARRHQLYEELKGLLGDESADELMSRLSPIGWPNIAAKADLGMSRSAMDAQQAETRGNLADIRGKLGGKIAALDAKLDSLNFKFDLLNEKLDATLALPS